MKYIISESQNKQLRISLFQKLIDSKLEYIKSTCNNQDEDDEIISDEYCVDSDVIDKIEVQDFHVMKRSNDSVLTLEIKIYFTYIRSYYDFEEFGYFLRKLLSEYMTGVPLIIKISDIQNSRSSFDW